MHDRLAGRNPVPLHHALLSLLAAGDSYGYELRQRFEASVGPGWGSLNIGHVYQLLRRLEREGWAQAAASEAGPPGRPDRLLFTITPGGRAELDAWLAEPVPPPAGYRDELHLKLTAAGARGERELGAVVARERAGLLVELHALTATGSTDAVERVLRRGAALRVRARLELLDAVEDDRDFAAACAAAVKQRSSAASDAAPRRESA